MTIPPRQHQRDWGTLGYAMPQHLQQQKGRQFGDIAAGGEAGKTGTCRDLGRRSEGLRLSPPPTGHRFPGRAS